MGWTFAHKDPRESATDFLRRECLTWDVPPEARPEVIASAEGHSAIAFAVRFPPAYWSRHLNSDQRFIPEPDGSVTTAILFLIDDRSQMRVGNNFGYKEIGETAGPYDTVPASILRQLSRLDLERGGESAKWAQAWRDRCKAHSDHRPARRHGDR